MPSVSEPAARGRRIKIAYLLPNIESGGTERHVLSLARSLDRARFSLSLVTTAGGGTLHKAFSELLPVTVMGDPARGKRFRTGPLEHVKTIRALVRMFRGDRPDILHAYLPAANVIGPIAAKLAGVGKVIISKRALSNYKARFPLLRKVEPLGNLLADAILVNSDAVRREVEKAERFFEGKFRKIHNGIAPVAPWTREQASRFRASQGIPPEAPAVLTVSNFYPYKGHEDLVEAIPRVAGIHPEVLFLFVGRDSGTLERTRQRIGQLGLEKHVRFAGDRSDVMDFVRACDLFAHPSHEEGFSNAILEAMAGGLPVVACDVGGNPEAVKSGVTGLLVPPRDPERLSAAILELLADGEKRRRMGEAGRRRATEEFSFDRMVKEMEALYESVLGEKR
jgi:glycosyltransferase involved in cell wall biosynthesis